MLFPMRDEVWRALIAERGAIQARWEALLRNRGATSPLGNPDALVFMMDWTLEEFFTRLHEATVRRSGDHLSDHAECPCGMNPLLHYFDTGEIALTEALHRVHEKLRGISAVDQGEGMQALCTVFRKMRRREIETLCAVCQRRPHCRGKEFCQTRPAPAAAPGPWIRSR